MINNYDYIYMYSTVVYIFNLITLINTYINQYIYNNREAISL